MKQIVDAIRAVFTSPAVLDRNYEPANVVDALAQVAASISYAAKVLGNGDAATPMGAIEAHGKAITDAADTIAAAIDGLAQSIRDH